jgi:hypothetical protein
LCGVVLIVREDIVQADPPELQNLRTRLAETDGALRPELEAATERFRTSAAELDSLLALEKEALVDVNEALASIQDRLDRRFEEIAMLGNVVSGDDGVFGGVVSFDAQRKLDERTREIVTLSRLLQERERSAKRAEDSVAWLRDVHSVLFSCPSWWGFIPARWQERKRAALLHKKGLFDGRAYLDRYPDVAQDGINPLRHYILSGQAEGRLR